MSDKAFIVFCVAVLFTIGILVRYSIKHPCVETREYPCATSNCAAWVYAGKVMMCVRWDTRPSTCQECVARK